MALNRFRSWLMRLQWQHRIIATISLAVVMAVIIAPPVFSVLGGAMGWPIFLTALITTAIVVPPLVYSMAMIERVAQQHKQEAVLARQDAERRNEIFQSLLESSVAMQKSGQLVALLDGMLMRLHRLLPHNQFGIIVDSSRPQMVRYFSARDITERESRILIENNHRLLDKEQRSVIRKLNLLDGNHDVEWSFMPMHGRNGQVIGKLIVKGKPLSLIDTEVLTIFMEQLTAATENKLLTIELEKLANTDNLTGVYNRNFFNHELARQQELKESNPRLDFSVLVIDINGLKMVNDTLGHVAGDRLITATADLLLTSCRDEDCVARIGGDEFVIICPGTNRDQAQRLYERLHKRSRMQNLEFHTDDPNLKRFPLRISIGVACSSETPQPAAVLTIADERMYEEKRAWYRNRADAAS